LASRVFFRAELRQAEAGRANLLRGKRQRLWAKVLAVFR